MINSSILCCLISVFTYNFVHCLIFSTVFTTVVHSTSVRLRGDRNEAAGLIEIQFNSTWYPVCYSFNNIVADQLPGNLICNQILGRNADSVIYSHIKHPEPTIDSLNISCQGHETDISQCNFQITNCYNRPTAGAICWPIAQIAETVGAATTNTTVNHLCENEGDFKCNTGVCIYKAWICDGEKDCYSGEDEENCTKYLDDFDKFEKFTLKTQPQQTWRLVTLDGCASKCSEAKDFICASFAFRSRSSGLSSQCLLSNQNRASGLDLEIDQHFDYYEKRTQLNTVVCNFTCSNGACISGDVICDGNDDCTDGSDEKDCHDAEISDSHFAVRIVNGSATGKGRVEVRLNGTWGVVCDDYWDIRDAHVLCREAGFPQGAIQALHNAQFGNGNGIYFMDDVGCYGNETSISKCQFKGWGIHDCYKDEAAAVACETSVKECEDNEFKCGSNKCILSAFVCDGDKDCFDGSDEDSQLCTSSVQLRLVNGPNNHSGRVEVYYRGKWGTICDDNWDDADAQVICKSLGYHGTATGHTRSKFGDGTGSIMLSNVHCFGLESSLEKCEKDPWFKHSCNHKEDAGVTCGEGQELINIPPLVKQILPNDCGQRSIIDYPKDLAWHGARIVGGMDSEYGAHPWQVGVRVKIGKSSLHWCGGTIISELFILSAAHCFDELTKTSYYVIRSGDYDNEEPETWEKEFLVDQIIIHEDFNLGRKLNNDIALIKIKPNNQGNGFQFNSHVGAACLPSLDTMYTPGTKCYISGWGSTGNRAVSRLQSAEIPILSRATCSRPQSYQFARLTPGMFCAGDMAGGVDSCKGDSGGPLVCKDSDRFILYGIVSWGHGCAEPNKPGIYTTVRQYLGWIYNKLENDTLYEGINN